jgi:drug/metabolite transporter (DMT)-like permease
MNAFLLQELQPMSIAAARMLLAALGCWVFVLVSGRLHHVTLRQAAELTAFGIFTFTLPYLIFAFALQHIASGMTGIINAATPALTVLVSHFWPGGERASLQKSLGVMAGFAGIVVLTVPLPGGGQATVLWAVLLALGAPLTGAISINVVRRFRKLDQVVLVAVALSGGALAVLPFALASDTWPEALSLPAGAALTMLGLINTAAAFIVLYMLLPKIGAANVSVSTLIAPPVSLALGIWLLDEPLYAEHLAGMAIILFGLLLIDGRLFKFRGKTGVLQDQPDG